MKKLIILAMVIIFSNFVLANIENYKPEDVIKYYGEYETKIPGFAKKLFGSERANIYIENYGEFSAVTKKGKLISYEKGLLDNPTINVYTDKETVEKIIQGELNFKDALDKKLVSYQAIGFWHKFKFKFLTGFAVFMR